MELFCSFMFHVYLCFAVLSVPCSLVITCLDNAGLLSFLCAVFSRVSVTFPYGVRGKVWYSIVSIPDNCFPLFFVHN